MSNADKIIEYIKKRSEVTAKELSDYLSISERSVFKNLAKLLEEGKLTKIGTPPKVFYKIKVEEEEVVDSVELSKTIRKTINNNFLYITPLGQYLEGVNGFIKWARERNSDVEKHAEQYTQLIKEINSTRKNGVINATQKVLSTFETTYLTDVFYIDFYSIPQFGKTKLGQLLLYAKQSQDKKRIKEISNLADPYLEKVIKHKKIDAIGFIPPTIKREIQFMKELEKNLKINLPLLEISKVKTEIIVPQKTLNKLSDRIINAENTLMVEEKRIFDRVLLIDDAIGSGATLNQTAKKIIQNGIAEKVYGLAIVGSYKGFEVISEV